MRRRRTKKQSPALAMARRRNWAKMRVSGMYATARQMAEDGFDLRSDERVMLGEIASLCKEILDRW